ncbi:RNA polymerase sigma factor [Afipia sp. NBIMC_P1-C3]|uniref:RNA polymerase sigma factor n=2 Tax=Bacteria TaxID=2 RepID=UPI0031BAB003
MECWAPGARRGAAKLAESNQTRLKRQLAENYDTLVKHLTGQLGSSEFAYEVLHETFVRLDRVPDATLVEKPADYVFRTAINVAKNLRKARTYRVPASEIDALLEVTDNRPSPAQIAEERSDFEAFERALRELPERPHHVLRMMSLEGKTAEETAEALGVSVRTVSSDYQHALQHCAKSIDRRISPRLGGPRRRT